MRQTLTDVTEAAGLADFLHAGFLGNATHRPAFTEAMGPGLCWLDADGDGLLDLYLVNGRYFTDAEKEAALQPTSRLYRNLGGGAFSDVTRGSGLGLRAWGQGCAAADHDNDGDTDLFVAGYGLQALFRNDGGTFTNVTTELGLDGAWCGVEVCWGSGGTWFDGDRDGCLDLYVSRFGNYTLGSGTPNGPEWAPQQRNGYYRGGCGAPFVDATETAGFTTWGNTWSAVAYDIDDDGWSDLYVSNDGDPNELWLNDGDGTFTLSPHAADPRAGMGTAIGDLNADGRPDLGTTNYVNEDNGIYLQLADGSFDDIGDTSPFTQARPYAGWAMLFHDIDHDGLQDVVVVNGMTEDIEPIIKTAEPVHVYRQRETGSFEQWNTTLGGAILSDLVARGAAWADYDEDGDLDMAIAEAGENPTHLWRTERPTGNFLSISLVGNAPGVTRDAEGAKVTLSAEGIPTSSKEKRAQQGFMSSNDPRVQFGLGSAQRADMTIRWPDGATQTFSDVPANAFVRIVQGGPLEILRRLPLLTATGPGDVERGVAGTFTATLDADVARVAWDFGDGQWAICKDGVCIDERGATVGSLSGRTATVAHAFPTIGRYDSLVVATDTAGHETVTRVRGDVRGRLLADLAFDAERFGVDEQARGTGRVVYEGGYPVMGASVRVDIVYSFWPQVEEAALPVVPAGVRSLGGYRTVTLEGVTDAAGEWRFEVPLWWQSPIPAARAVQFNPLGDYAATLSGGFRGSAFDNASAAYQVRP